MLVAAVLALFGLLTPTVAATVAEQERRVDRVLVISLPHVSWSDLEEYGPDALPNIHRLLARSGVANLSTRAPRIRPDLAGGYATLSAGDKAVASGGPDDGAGFAVDERVGVGTCEGRVRPPDGHAGLERARATRAPADRQRQCRHRLRSRGGCPRRRARRGGVLARGHRQCRRRRAPGARRRAFGRRSCSQRGLAALPARGGHRVDGLAGDRAERPRRPRAPGGRRACRVRSSTRC